MQSRDDQPLCKGHEAIGKDGGDSQVTGSGIYEIRHVGIGKRYIGSAKNFAKRWKAHRNHLLRGTHHAPYLQHAWNKYGESAFQFNILELCEHEDLLDREQGWFDLSKPEYNVCPTAYSTAGRVHSAETRAKIGKSKAGLKMPPRSDAYKAKLSEIHKGKSKPAHVLEALQAGREAYTPTAENLRKRSASLRRAYETGLRTREKTDIHKTRIGQHFAKLSDEEVRELKRLSSDGVTGRKLAVKFGIPTSSVSLIINGKTYRWVE